MKAIVKIALQLILAVSLSLPGVPLLATEIVIKQADVDDPPDRPLITRIDANHPAAQSLRHAESLISQQKAGQALAVLNDILDQYPGNRHAMYTKAKLLAAANRLDESQEIVDVLMREEPPAAVVLHLQGFIYSRRQQWPEALEYYQQAYPHGHDRYLMNTMTQAYLRVQGPNAAIDFLSAHLLEYPAEHNVRLLRAKLYQGQQMFSAAYDDYEFIKIAQPENPVTWKNLADMLITQRDRRAIPYAREAVRLAPTVAEVKDTLGRALLEFGEPAEALEVLTAAHKSKPRDASIAYDYALALAANKDVEGTRKLMTELAKSDSPIGTRATRYLEDMQQ